MEDKEVSLKPPLGIIPEVIWNERRIWDILDAIRRYVQVGKSCPVEWLDELENLLQKNQKMRCPEWAPRRMVEKCIGTCVKK